MINFRSPQDVALITGAYGGIGVAYCEECAQRGFPLAISGRDATKLDQLAAELRDKYTVPVHVFPMDLATETGPQDLYQAVTDVGLNVELLINNAGILRNEPVHESSVTTNNAMLDVNMKALTTLATLASKDMVVRGHGQIVNMASTASWVAIPEQNIYAATKAYVRHFSLAMNNELKARNTGVNTTTVCPNWTATRMLSDPGQGKILGLPEVTFMTPQRVAKEAMRGVDNNKAMVVPGGIWGPAMYLSQFLPVRLMTAVFGFYYRSISR